MKYAKLSDLKTIYKAFQKRKDWFVHIRPDKLQLQIEAGQVIWQSGVVIIYQQYKKRVRIGDVNIPVGAIMLHQILNTKQFNGKGGEVFDRFVEEIVSSYGGDLYLSVRKENIVARTFYEKHGMSVVGKIFWSDGKMPGVVYYLNVSSKKRLF